MALGACLVALILAFCEATNTETASRSQHNLKLIKEHFAHLDEDLVLMPWFQKYLADDVIFKYCPNSANNTNPNSRYPNCVYAKGKEAYLNYVRHNLYSKHVYFTNTVQTAPVYFVSEDGSQVIAKFDVNGDLAGKALPSWEMEVMAWRFNKEGQIEETDFFTDTLFWHDFLKEAEAQPKPVQPQPAEPRPAQLKAIDIPNHGLYPPLGGKLTFGQYEVYYNSLSVCIFAFSAMTFFIFAQLHAVSPAYRTAVVVAGLSPLISTIEFCMSLFSFTTAASVTETNGEYHVEMTGKPYLHDWLFADLTAMPITLVALVLVLRLKANETLSLCLRLSLASVAMLLFAFFGDIHTPSLLVGMGFFAYIIYMLVVDFGEKNQRQPFESQGAFQFVRYLILVSWVSYPFIAVLPMLGLGGEFIWKVMQIGYATCDVIMKGAVPCFIWVIAARKTEEDTKSALLPPL